MSEARIWAVVDEMRGWLAEADDVRTERPLHSAEVVIDDAVHAWVKEIEAALAGAEGEGMSHTSEIEYTRWERLHFKLLGRWPRSVVDKRLTADDLDRAQAELPLDIRRNTYTADREPGLHVQELRERNEETSDVEAAAFELYAAGPWGEPFQFVNEGAHLITDAHSMDVYRDMVRDVLDTLGTRGALVHTIDAAEFERAKRDPQVQEFAARSKELWDNLKKDGGFER